MSGSHPVDRSTAQGVVVVVGGIWMTHCCRVSLGVDVLGATNLSVPSITRACNNTLLLMPRALAITTTSAHVPCLATTHATHTSPVLPYHCPSNSTPMLPRATRLLLTYDNSKLCPSLLLLLMYDNSYMPLLLPFLLLHNNTRYYCYYCVATAIPAQWGIVRQLNFA